MARQVPRALPVRLGLLVRPALTPRFPALRGLPGPQEPQEQPAHRVRLVRQDRPAIRGLLALPGRLVRLGQRALKVQLDPQVPRVKAL